MKSDQDVSAAMPPSRPDSRASACSTRNASPLSTSRPGSGDSAGRHPIRMPKAPQSKEVAQRLIRHSQMRPIARFDSADYFLTLHNAEQKRLSEAVESGEEKPKAELSDGSEWLDQTPPPPPPPTARNAHALSPDGA